MHHLISANCALYFRVPKRYRANIPNNLLSQFSIEFPIRLIRFTIVLSIFVFVLCKTVCNVFFMRFVVLSCFYLLRLRLSQIFGNIVEYSPPPPGLQIERFEVDQHRTGWVVVVQGGGTAVGTARRYRAGAAG